MKGSEMPPELFRRQDETPDHRFYAEPRFVTHIDDATIIALTEYYRETLRAGDRLLDLMSSWVSHLPGDVVYGDVAGLGMNREELAANPRLDRFEVRDLNADPTLPWEDSRFDTVMIAVSIQYLITPFEVFSEIVRVLKDGGRCIIAMSHRLFPTKAVYAFQTLSLADRCRLVAAYMESTGAIGNIESIDRSPANADPLWIVTGRRLPR
ncbi:MAG: methyltransferase domain-containing protein [Proteobacteria bacterium]|nr:methyltransferase domain-containing protein [Pseudomonadota bacterium]